MSAESLEVSRWEVALAQVEADLDRAEALVAPGYLLDSDGVPSGEPWSPPADLGPLPAGLVDRAQQILDRQERLVPHLEAAAQTARTHLRTVGSMRTKDTSTSVYVDAFG